MDRRARAWQRGRGLDPERPMVLLARCLAVGLICSSAQVMLVYPLDSAKTLLMRDQRVVDLASEVSKAGLARLYWGWRIMMAHYIVINVVQTYFMQKGDKLFGISRDN